MGCGKSPPSFCDNRRVPLTSTCLCLLLRTRGDGARQVLLGYKKTGFGRGKVVAPGGHVEPGESAAAAAAREVKEESGIRVSQDALTEAARLTFRFPAHPSWDMDVAIFTSDDWSGEATESDEIRPQWFPVTARPQEQAQAGGGQRHPPIIAERRRGFPHHMG